MHDYDAVIVGAGIAGLYAVHRLRGLGLRVRAYEAGAGVGGTWYWNRYPGARVDVESLFYSYSFDPALEQEWEWTEKYPAQPEILRYLEHVADRFDLRRDIALETTVTAASWDGDAGRWELALDPGGVVRGRLCILATGALSIPKQVDIPGAETFAGEIYATSRWPEHEVDFAGKRVGVVGTGSSGVQAIPEIARSAHELTVFQRTANFSSPAHNRPLARGEQDDVKQRYAELRETARTSRNGLPVVRNPPAFADVADAEREALYAEHWQRGGPTAFLSAFSDVMISEQANRSASDYFRDRIRDAVDDPETAEALCPVDNPIGGKRLTVDTGYYETFNRDNVTLVDLHRSPIRTITRDGLRTADADYALDLIVLATGFDAMTGSFLAIDVRGRDGVRLADEWAAGPRTLLGLQSAGFPNLFLICGPGSPSVISNMIVSIEQHVDFVADLIAWMDGRGARVVEPDRAAQDAWVDHVNELAAATLFPRANSWYMGANVPGKPRIFMPYIGGVGTYRATCDEVAAAGYEGFRFDAAATSASPNPAAA